MNISTIDKIIDSFDNEYEKNRKNLYDKYHSLDKFIELSKEYVNTLDLDSYQKEIFENYFKAHVMSMYRRDFEKELLELERRKYSLSKKDKFIIYTSWGALFGAIGSSAGYLASNSDYGMIIGSIVGISLGLLFAHKGIPNDGLKQNIIGTQRV
ncbi:MAG: hypothetical protein KatS3mg002_1524 [Candidatus Woesearchaeota archaeon]|nr:MAG: hypothetical protein KatS3mg002_1524 [Candidatus Woesearchaeota archaeon]